MASEMMRGTAADAVTADNGLHATFHPVINTVFIDLHATRPRAVAL